MLNLSRNFINSSLRSVGMSLGRTQALFLGFNILEVIKYMASSSSSSFSLKGEEILRLLHSFGLAPLEYVCNPIAKRFLTGVHKAGGNMILTPAVTLKHVKKKMHWNPY